MDKRKLIIASAIVGVLTVGVAGYCWIRSLGLTTLGPGLPIPVAKQMRVPTGSMLPTLNVGQLVDVDLVTYLRSSPKLGEVVLFVAPSEAFPPGRETVYLFSRIVGLPGDVVEIRASKLYRNEQVVEEPYVRFLDGFGATIPNHELPTFSRDFKLVKNAGGYWPLSIDGDFVNGEPGRTAPRFQVESIEEMRRLNALPAARVPDGFCLVMGDNRFNAYDSRGWGPLHLYMVVGRVVMKG